MPSSVIQHFHYNAEKRQLNITFVSGSVYCYRDVPEKTVKLFKASASKGQFFNWHIKDKFKFVLLSE